MACFIDKVGKRNGEGLLKDKRNDPVLGKQLVTLQPSCILRPSVGWCCGVAVKLWCAIPASFLKGKFVFQLPAPLPVHVPGKAVEDDPSCWALTPAWET